MCVACAMDPPVEVVGPFSVLASESCFAGPQPPALLSTLHSPCGHFVFTSVLISFTRAAHDIFAPPSHSF